MKKRYSFIFAIVFLLVSVITGCGSNNEDNETNNSGETGNNVQNNEANNNEQNDQEDVDKEEVTIKFHTHGNEENYNWQDTLAAFEAEYPHIKVDLIILSEKGDSQEATQKLDLAAASGEQMDILMFSDPASYAERVGLGMVAPIDEFIEEEGYVVTEEYKVDTILDG